MQAENSQIESLSALPLYVKVFVFAMLVFFLWKITVIVRTAWSQGHGAPDEPGANEEPRDWNDYL